MKINKIELFNIGSYEGKNEFDIAAQNANGKITVIGGKNGAGKTTLFSGIKLCLYGHKEAGYQAINMWYKNTIKKLINDKAKLENSPKAYVAIELSIFNGQEWDDYVLKREWNLNSDEFEKFTVIKNMQKLSVDETLDFENYMLNLIPPQLFDLYFFDGEQIADFFLEENNGSRIKEAFLTICGYDTFDILYKNFKRLSRTAEVKNDALENYFAAEENLTEAEKRLKAVRTEISLLSSEIIDIDTELEGKEKRFKSAGGVSVEEWNNRFLEIKNEERIREEKNAWLKTAANEKIPYIILEVQIKELLSMMEEEQELEKKDILVEAMSGLIPEALKSVQMRHPTLDDNINNEIMSAIMAKLAADQPSKDMILKLSKDEYQFLLQQISRVLEYEKSEVLSVRKEIKQSIKRSQQLRDVIETSNITGIDSFLQEKESLIERKQSAIEARYVKYDEEKAVEKEVEQAAAAYKQAEKSLDKQLKNESLANLTTKSILFLDALQKRLFASEIAKVEKLFMEKMVKLMRKDSFISSISIDNDFNVHVYKQIRIDSKGVCNRIKQTSVEEYVKEFGNVHCEDILKVSKCLDLNEFVDKYADNSTIFDVMVEFDKSTMSKGEKQVFIMALYWAITQLCNKEIPFIIDTPFARIDTEHRSHITEYFFKELKGQVLIFSTDEEITEEHMNVIGKDLQSKFLIENTDNKKTTITANKYFGD